MGHSTPLSGSQPGRTARPRVQGDRLFHLTLLVVAGATLAIFALMLPLLMRDAWPVLERFGLGFVTGTDWSPIFGRESFGALPYILGTLVTSLIALLVGVPLGIGIAIFLAELSPAWLRTPLSFTVELLAAVPSVIYGLWGLFVFRFWVRDLIEKPLMETLGFIPLFQNGAFGLDIFTAGQILAIMIIPTIAAVSREALLAVPQDQREAAYSLGATRWEVIRTAVLPYARSGLVGAVILGLARAIGETMAVTMVIGNAVGAQALPTSLFKPGQTMASLIANEFNEADPITLHPAALIGVGLILFAFALAVNVFAQLILWRMARIRRAQL